MIALKKEPKNSLQLPKPTRNTRRRANQLMTVVSPDIILKRKHNVICHEYRKGLAKKSRESHNQRLRYPRLSLAWWFFPQKWRNPCTFRQAQLFTFANIYFSFKSLNSLGWSGNCEIGNKLMTIASGEINLQKHNLTCHVAKVKAATSAHSMADVIPFF